MRSIYLFRSARRLEGVNKRIARWGVREKYDFRSVEGKYKERIDGLRPNRKGEGYLCVPMFPYPSGSLHMGHLRVYTISDVIARYETLRDKKVVHGIGWDAFGLPAENAARDRGIAAKDWTQSNIAAMKNQFERFFMFFNWDREVNTCSPEYYRWTQWIFLQLYEQGLAYRKASPVNWDPIDETVLANEQVDANGKSWRSGAQVERRNMNQWFLAITSYNDELYHGLDGAEGWSKQVIQQQKQWIGKSEGYEVVFRGPNGESVPVFTTRLDTLPFVDFIALSKDHPLAKEWSEKMGKASDFELLCAQVEKKSYDRKKTQKPEYGYALPGVLLQCELTERQIPVYVADYVLGDYGHGVVMGVPAHDDRDAAFAKIMDIPSVERVKMEASWLEKAMKVHGSVQFKLRDWLVSRQRQWGTPIPIIHCPKCGPVGMDASQLPLLHDAPMEQTCPSCGEMGEREKDTLDTFMDSSWYFLRYLDAKNESLPIDRDIFEKHRQVDAYIGGKEHAVLHLLYARFIYKFLCDQYQFEGGAREPFRRVINQGMVLGKTYRSKEGEILMEGDERREGEDVQVTYEKMSKSKGNGISLEDAYGVYGADICRLYMLSRCPPELDMEWNDEAVIGAKRFVDRYWSIIEEIKGERDVSGEVSREQQEEIEKRVKGVNYEMGEKRRQFHLAYSKLMSFGDHIYRYVQDIGVDAYVVESMKVITIMMNPMAPFVTAEAWKELCGGTGDDILDQTWPSYEDALKQKGDTLYVRVNGKLVDEVMREAGIEDKVLGLDTVKGKVGERKVKKVVYVPERRLINVLLYWWVRRGLL